MAAKPTAIECVLLTWHGTVLCAGTGGELTQESLDAPDSLARAARLTLVSPVDPSFADLVPIADEALRLESNDLGNAAAKRAADGRGYTFLRETRYLCAQREDPHVGWDREQPGHWERFLPVPVSFLSKLAALPQQPLIAPASGELIPAGAVAFKSDFLLSIGAYQIDLTQGHPLFLFEPGAKGNATRGAVVIVQGNKVTAFAPWAEDPKKDPQRIWLRNVGHTPGNIHGPAGQPADAYDQDAAVLKCAEMLYFPPAFVERAHREFFVKKAWTRRPRLGYTTSHITAKRANGCYMFLARGLEGLLFDARGVYKDWGYLTVCNTFPAGLTQQGDRYFLDAAVMNAAPLLAGDFMVFYNGNLQSYYHWMAEGIISLFLLQKLMHGRASVVLPAGLEAIAKVPYRDSLKLFSFGDYDLSFSDAPVVRLERATWVDPVYLAEDFPEHILREFQAAATAAIGPQREPLRLYVERTHNRGVANAQEVRDSLERLGFMTVRLEDLPLLEQARLFANAEFIVATHGAGLSNLIFAPPSARIIELTPDSEMRPFFWFLSQKLGQEYGMLPCPSEGGQFNGNLQVDVKKLMRLFNLLENA